MALGPRPRSSWYGRLTQRAPHEHRQAAIEAILLRSGIQAADFATLAAQEMLRNALLVPQLSISSEFSNGSGFIAGLRN
jgi:hypothetical protein